VDWDGIFLVLQWLVVFGHRFRFSPGLWILDGYEQIGEEGLFNRRLGGVMRVNVYAEEMTSKIEIIAKNIDGQRFTGLRLYLELPATVNGKQHKGPFIHRPGDDDSSAVTFWGKRDLRKVLRKMLSELDKHYKSEKKIIPVLKRHGVLGGCYQCKTNLKPAEPVRNWKRKVAVERMGMCRGMLHLHGFLTDSQSATVHKKIVAWARTHEPYVKMLKEKGMSK